MSSKGNGNFLDVVTNVATLGLVGYDEEEGGFRAGGVTHALDEGLGEVTGRNLAREQMNKAGEAVQREDAARRQQMLDEQERRYREDFAASSGARGIRNSAAVRSRGGAARANTLSDEQDFLGL